MTAIPEPLHSMSRHPLASRGDAGRADVHTMLARHRSSVYAFIRSRGFNGEDAEDLTQETYLRAMRALPRFAARSSRPSGGTWCSLTTKSIRASSSCGNTLSMFGRRLALMSFGLRPE